MARESSITFEQVSATADSIRAAGGKPSTRAVREVLGTGSQATVLKFLQQWQGNQARASQAMDDTLDPAISRAISNAIAGRVQEATADSTARLADLQGEAEAVIAESERLAAEIEVLGAELGKYHDLAAELGGRVQQLEADAARGSAELTYERAATEAARVELAKAELRLEAVPGLADEVARLRAELLQVSIEAAELRGAAVAKAGEKPAAAKKPPKAVA